MVSNELHFTRAAEKLGISQPTLSHQIKVLENEVGFPLFNRIGKKIELTKVGEIVRNEALNIRGSLNRISSQIEVLKNIEVGELNIAVLPGEITDLTSTLCIRFNQLYPNIKVFLETTDQVEKAILENRADFGIGFHMSQNNLLQVTELYEEEFYLISNKRYEEQSVTFSSILEDPLILFPSMHQCRKLIDKTSYEMGYQFEPIVETSSIQSILSLVRSGVGRSIVSRTLYEFYDTKDLFYQKIEKPTLNSQVFLAMKKGGFINFAARQYIKLLLLEIEKLNFHIDKTSIQSLQPHIL